MDLSIREAAPLLGRSPRAVRAKIARGELPARKHGRTWRVPLATLPLTTAQRDSLQRRSDVARLALEAVLPSRSPIDRDHRRRSVLDLLAFSRGIELLREWSRVEPQCADLLRACRRLRHCLVDLAGAAVEYSPAHRIDVLRNVRFGLGRIVGLLLSSTEAPEAALHAIAHRLEQRVIAPIGGLLRQAEQRQRP